MLSTLVRLLLALDLNELLVFTVLSLAFDRNNLVGGGGVLGSEAFHVGVIFALVDTLHERVFHVLHVLGHLVACALLELVMERFLILLLNLLL